MRQLLNDFFIYVDIIIATCYHFHFVLYLLIVLGSIFIRTGTKKIGYIRGFTSGTRDEAHLAHRQTDLARDKLIPPETNWSRPRLTDPGRYQILPARAFSFLAFRPGGDCLYGIFIPGCQLIPIIGARMRSSPDELVPPQNHANCSKEITRYWDEFIPEWLSSLDKNSHV